MPDLTVVKEDLQNPVARLVAELMKLPTGAASRLRRMEIDGPGELEFWKLARDCKIREDEAGIRFVRILAFLTPRGDAASRRPFHNLGHSFGAALVEAGFSERRLASFLALPFARRGDALEAMVRLIARKMKNGVNCVDIGHLLFVNDVWPLRQLAKSYYAARDRAAAELKKEQTI